MALCDAPLVDFNKSVNRQTLIYLSINDAVLSPPHPTEFPDIAQLRLTLKDQYQYRGTGVIKYNRLNLADLNTVLVKPPNVNPVSNRLYQMLDELTQGTGILLTEDDVYDSSIVNDPVRGLNVELKAKPESYRWYGIHRLYFSNLPPLSVVLKRLNLIW